MVVNYDLPNIPETYVHRIGRTARAGAGGTAVSFCDTDEKPYLRDIQRLINQSIPVIQDHPFTVNGDEEARDEIRVTPEQPKTNALSLTRRPDKRDFPQIPHARKKIVRRGNPAAPDPSDNRFCSDVRSGRKKTGNRWSPVNSRSVHSGKKIESGNRGFRNY